MNLSYAFHSLVPALCLLSLNFSPAAVYDIGDGQTYSTIGDAPIENLQAGDIVRIHYRSTPYAWKWCCGGAGTSGNPIVFQGVPDGSGNLPVITGQDAVTSTKLDYYNEQRGIISVGNCSVPPPNPTYIVIENLEIIRAHPDYSYRDDSGSWQNYSSEDASGIFIGAASHVTIRSCIIHDCANGIQSQSQSSDLVIENCWFYGNGMVGSEYQHNTYTCAQGMTYQYNRFGPLRDGARGSGLKDRSARLTVRYNWIEDGNRELSIVEAYYSSVYNRSDYDPVFIYGNCIIENDPSSADNNQLISFGGDGTANPDQHHKMLYFYNNTVISYRSDRTYLFYMPTNNQHVDCRNNIFYLTHQDDPLGTYFSIIDDYGNVDMRNNFILPGYVDKGWGGYGHGTVTVIEPNIEGANPGFADFAGRDFALTISSPGTGTAIALPAACLPDNTVTEEYVKHRGNVDKAAADDIGAFGCFEYGELAFTQSAYSVAEAAGTLTASVTRSGGADGAASVTITSTQGTAVSGSDYQPPAVILQWNNGEEGSRTFTIDILDDNTIEPDETFQLGLGTITGGVVAGSPDSATVTITNDDFPGEVRFSGAEYSAGENSGTAVVFLERANGSSGEVSAVVSTSDGTALAAADYTAATTTFTWPDGDASVKSLSISIVDDGQGETVEQFTVEIESTSGGASTGQPSIATVTIFDDDNPKSKSGSGCFITESSCMNRYFPTVVLFIVLAYLRRRISCGKLCERHYRCSRLFLMIPEKLEAELSET